MGGAPATRRNRRTPRTTAKVSQSESEVANGDGGGGEVVVLQSSVGGWWAGYGTIWVCDGCLERCTVRVKEGK